MTTSTGTRASQALAQVSDNADRLIDYLTDRICYRMVPSGDVTVMRPRIRQMVADKGIWNLLTTPPAEFVAEFKEYQPQSAHRNSDEAFDIGLRTCLFETRFEAIPRELSYTSHNPHASHHIAADGVSLVLRAEISNGLPRTFNEWPAWATTEGSEVRRSTVVVLGSRGYWSGLGVGDTATVVRHDPNDNTVLVRRETGGNDWVPLIELIPETELSAPDNEPTPPAPAPVAETEDTVAVDWAKRYAKMEAEFRAYRNSVAHALGMEGLNGALNQAADDRDYCSDYEDEGNKACRLANTVFNQTYGAAMRRWNEANPDGLAFQRYSLPWEFEGRETDAIARGYADVTVRVPVSTGFTYSRGDDGDDMARDALSECEVDVSDIIDAVRSGSYNVDDVEYEEYEND